MKVKLSKLQNSLGSINALAGTKLNFKTSYDIAKRLKAIVAELELLEKTRIAKLEEFSEGLMKDNQYILGDNEEKFKREFEELMDSEVELDILPLKYADLVDVSIEPSHLINLDFLIAE